MPRKERVGVVVSDKMQKTRVVKITEKKSHTKYGKIQTWTTKFKAHDETNESHEGDTVKIVESRPFSKEKKWAVAEILKRKEV